MLGSIEKEQETFINVKLNNNNTNRLANKKDEEAYKHIADKTKTNTYYKNTLV